MNRIAPTEKILMETDEKVKRLKEQKINYVWGGETIRMLEISGLKAQAYDRIHKIFMEDS